MSARAEWKDLFLPLAVLAVVGMMIFPLPAGVLDILLMFNISFSLALLASAVYLTEPERFTSLPTVLLLTTLFRLGLNISTTRQLLGSGEAPQVVTAFGNFVVGGNIIVGVVVFSIVTIIQFIVIAKGAERVAEVSARFTLDALPGKQMSIDADLRSGILNLAEARERRLALQREAKLYGALDGAMKFVKGDAIACVLITLINISAGLVIGVTRHGLSLGEALQKYTVFTVGDGLVSQIPALLVAVSAGIAITRVGDKEDSLLGRDIFAQLSAEPQALSTAGLILCVLAFVPGLPLLPFFSMGLCFLWGAHRRGIEQKREDDLNRHACFRPRVYAGIFLRLSPRAVLCLQEEGGLAQRIQSLRDQIFAQRGVIVPDVQFEIDSCADGMSAELYFKAGCCARVVHGEAEGKGGRPGPAGEPKFSEMVELALRQVLEARLSELVDDTQTRILLDTYQPVAEDLINHVIPEIVSVTVLSTILRQLIREQVSLRNLPAVLQAIAEYHVKREHGTIPGHVVAGNDAVIDALCTLGEERKNGASRLHELLAEVRIALGRTIVEPLAGATGELAAWRLDSLSDHLFGRIALSSSVIEPRLADMLIAKVREAGTHGEAKDRLVLLASRYARGLLASLLLPELNNLHVLAVEEIPNEIKVKLQGVIGIDHAQELSDKDAAQEAGRGVEHDPTFSVTAAAAA